METIYTPKLLAERWGCSEQIIRTAIKEGTLPAFRVGRLMRIRGQAVCAFEQRN